MLVSNVRRRVIMISMSVGVRSALACLYLLVLLRVEGAPAKTPFLITIVTGNGPKDGIDATMSRVYLSVFGSLGGYHTAMFGFYVPVIDPFEFDSGHETEFDEKMWDFKNLTDLQVELRYTKESWKCESIEVVKDGGGPNERWLFTFKDRIYAKKPVKVRARAMNTYGITMKNCTSKVAYDIQLRGSNGPSKFRHCYYDCASGKEHQHYEYDVGTITGMVVRLAKGLNPWIPFWIKVADKQTGKVYKFTIESNLLSNHTYTDPKLRHNYVVVTETKSTQKKSLTAQVWIKLSGSYGTEEAIHLGKVGVNFQAGKVEAFPFLLHDVGPISGIELRLHGKDDWWEPYWLDVEDKHRGTVHRFTLRRLKTNEGTVKFTNPWRRDRAVAMCHYHRYRTIQPQTKKASSKPMNIKKNQNYPCTHIIYGENIFIRANEADLKYKLPENGRDRQELHKLSLLHGYKLFLTVKIDFYYNLKTLVGNLIRQLRQYGFHGIEIDTGTYSYRFVYNKRALDDLVISLHDGFKVESKIRRPRLELSVVVNSNSNWTDWRSHYNLKVLSTYADYVVVNAMVNEWPDPSPYDLSTLSPSPLYKANRGGVSQSWSIDAWVKAGLVGSKIIVPFATYAWNTPYCVKRMMPQTDCKGFYDSSFLQIYKTPDANLVPYFELCHGRKPYMDKMPYKLMQRGPGAPFENEQSVRARAKFVATKQLRGTKVLFLQYDDFGNFCKRGSFPLTTMAYKQLVNPFFDIKKSQASTNKSGKSSRTERAGLSAVLVIMVISAHLCIGH